MLSEKLQKKLEISLQRKEEKKRKERLKRKKNKKTKQEVAVENTKTTIKKKRVGRPKKRGPKKKRIRRKIIKIQKPRPVIDFKIVTVLNGKQNGYIGSYQTYADAYGKLEELERENASILFPRKFLNKGVISDIKEEYLLLERNRFGDKTDNMLRNEFGKFVKQKIVNNNNWIIRDKIKRLVEESFWVYGYDPKIDRKNYNWILENLIFGALENSYDIIRIMVYKNKLVIRYDDRPINMVMCKNKSDAIRLYNLISDEVRSKKTKQIVCIGSLNIICESRRLLEQEIMDLTGWSKRKLQRSTN